MFADTRKLYKNSSWSIKAKSKPDLNLHPRQNRLSWVKLEICSPPLTDICFFSKQALRTNKKKNMGDLFRGMNMLQHKYWTFSLPKATSPDTGLVWEFQIKGIQQDRDFYRVNVSSFHELQKAILLAFKTRIVVSFCKKILLFH